MPSPRVAALVLSYNGREVTLHALASLSRLVYDAVDLVVIDNGSVDGTAAAIEEAFPDVRLLRIEENRGPANGVNAGMRWALERRYDYLLILNNDIEADPRMLEELVAAAERDATIGCVGPKAYYHADRHRIWSAGGRIRFREAVTSERGEGELDSGQYDVDEEVPYVNGCAMLVSRRAAEAAGLWDPVYHLSVEDADFCMRVRHQGFKCYYAHRARLWHMVSVTAGGYLAARTYQTGRSTMIFLRRYASPWQWLTALLFMAVGMPAAFLRELPRRNTAAVLAKLRGFRDGWQMPLPPPPAAPRPTREGEALAG